MAKNHAFLGLLCVVAVCLHLHFACYNLKPNTNSRPGFESAKNQSAQSGVLNKNNADQPQITARYRNAPPKLSPKQLQVQKIYTSQIGVKEKGHNAGKQVEAYLAYVGLGKGHAWCAAFICWVYGKADIPNPKTPWTPSLFPVNRRVWTKDQSIQPRPKSSTNQQKSAATRQKSNSKTPQTGDIFGLYFPEKKRIAHAGFVDSWDENWVITVEGNTNADGHRDGDGVYRKRRLTKSIYYISRYIPLGYP